MKKAFIRVDASVQIGSGHVMRCLTLAGNLVQQGREAFFICRDLPGNLIQYIQNKGFTVSKLPCLPAETAEAELQYLAQNWQQDAAETSQAIAANKTAGDHCLLVVDHYALDIKWERALRSVVDQIMVIDDLANRPHDCDKLLDQNYYSDMQRRYQGLVPACCELLLGPQYALLRPEFYAAKQKLRQRDGTVRRVLVFFGGSDPTGETFKALRAIQMLNRSDIIWDVVVGASNPRREEIKQVCSAMQSVRFYCQIDNIAELMVQADLAIGAGGSVTWERCFLGLPAIVVTVAENQVETVRDLAEVGAVWYLGKSETVDVACLIRMIKEAMNSPGYMIGMSQRGLAFFG